MTRMLAARLRAGLSREYAAGELSIGTRTLENYEKEPGMKDASTPSADITLAASRLYGCPELTSCFCAERCAIGSALGCHPVEAVALPESVLGLLCALDGAAKLMPAMIEIARDGRVTKDEHKAFRSVMEKMVGLNMAVEEIMIASMEYEPLEEIVQTIRKTRAATRVSQKENYLQTDSNTKTHAGARHKAA